MRRPRFTRNPESGIFSGWRSSHHCMTVPNWRGVPAKLDPAKTDATIHLGFEPEYCVAR